MINGVVAVPLMAVIMIMARRQRMMGAFVVPRPLWAMGWLSTGGDGGRGRGHVRDLVRGSAQRVPARRAGRPRR